MRNLRRFVSALLLSATLAMPGAARADGYVPASARTQVVRIKLADGRAERVQIAPTAHGYFVFPLFELTAAHVRFSDSEDATDVEPLALIQPDGRAAFHDYPGSTYAHVDVTVADLLGGDDAPAVYDALARSSDPAVKGKDREEPDLADQWTATLEVRDPDDGGRFLPVGAPWTFTRDGAGALTMTFVARRTDEHYQTTRTGFLLDHATAADLRLTITARYTAEFTTTDFRVTGDFMDQQSKELVSKLTSKAGDKQAVLFVPVGGDVAHAGSFDDLFERSMQFEIETRAGSAGKQPDADLVKMFIASAIGQFEKKVQLTDQAQDTMVSFLMSNGVRVTTPIGDVKKITDYFKTERDRKTHDLFEHLSREHTKVDVDTEASIDLLDLIGGSGKVAVDYDHMTEDQQKQVRDTFSHDLDEMAKTVDGSLPSVTTMNLSDLERISAGGYFRASLESAQFTEGTKDLPIRLGLDVPALRKAQPTAAFVRAIRERIDAASHGFDGWNEQRAPELPGSNYEHVATEYGTRLNAFIGGDRDVDRAEARLAEVADLVRASLPDGWTTSEEGSGTSRTVSARRGDAGPSVEVDLIYSSGEYTVVVSFEAPRDA